VSDKASKEDSFYEIDRIDRQLLDALQRDAGQSSAELAEQVNLSVNGCWRRVRRLDDRGIIRKRVALLDQQRLGLAATVFVQIKTRHHEAGWLERFARGVAAIPEVVEFYRLSGETDYLLKIVARDIADYDRVYKQLIAVVPLDDVSSAFAMERIKSTTALPLNTPGGGPAS